MIQSCNSKIRQCHNMPKIHKLDYIIELKSNWNLLFHSVLEWFIKQSPYPDQRPPQHESLYPIGLILTKIKILHIGRFLKNLCSGTQCWGFQFLLILELSVSFHAAVVFGLGEYFLFTSALGHCDLAWNLKSEANQVTAKVKS